MGKTVKSPTKRKRTYTTKVSKIALEKAKDEVNKKNLSVRRAAEKYRIKKSTLHDYLKQKHAKPVGRETVLSHDEELLVCHRIMTLAEWGFPLDMFDLRMLVKAYFDKRGIVVSRFSNNMPGTKWAHSFLKRHRETLSRRVSQNIKTERAKVTKAMLTKFYNNLKESIEGVPPENIINYDETNLTDDPGKKKIIVRRGSKYPERVMNSTKASISIMFSGTASGVLLPQYVVYKAIHLYDTWTEGGPPGTRYNRTPSGWFELASFDDWFHKIILPYAKDRTGRIVMIGDNLASHVSPSVIESCEKNNISFILLPPNSTHLTQPLDVAVFRPIKVHWRKVLENFKKSVVGRLSAALPKDCFPALLTELMDKVKETIADNLRSGFKKCGIYPLDPQKAISRLPEETSQDPTTPGPSTTSITALDSSVVNILKEMRHGTSPATAKPRRKKRLNVSPGLSISTIALQNETESQDEESEELQSLPQEDTAKTAAQLSTSTCAPNNEVQPSSQTAISTQNIGDKVVPSDWVVVRVPFHTKNRYRHYIANVVRVKPEIHVKFVKHVQGTPHTFVYPMLDDNSDIDKEDILKVLPEPSLDRKQRMIFDVDVNLWPK